MKNLKITAAQQEVLNTAWAVELEAGVTGGDVTNTDVPTYMELLDNKISKYSGNTLLSIFGLTGNSTEVALQLQKLNSVEVDGIAVSAHWNTPSYDAALVTAIAKTYGSLNTIQLFNALSLKTSVNTAGGIESNRKGFNTINAGVLLNSTVANTGGLSIKVVKTISYLSSGVTLHDDVNNITCLCNVNIIMKDKTVFCQAVLELQKKGESFKVKDFHVFKAVLNADGLQLIPVPNKLKVVDFKIPVFTLFGIANGNTPNRSQRSGRGGFRRI